MRQCVGVISAILVLTACGQAENVAATETAQTGQRPRTEQSVTYKRPPLPAGFTVLTADEVAKLIKRGAIIVTANSGHIGSRWKFDPKNSRVDVLHTGGIVPRFGPASFSLLNDGTICIPANAVRSEYSSCFIFAKNLRKTMFILRDISGVGSDERDWQQTPIVIK